MMQGLLSLRIIFQSSDTIKIRKKKMKFPESAASPLLQVLGIKFFVPKSCQSAISTVCFIQCCVVVSSVLHHRCLVDACGLPPELLKLDPFALQRQNKFRLCNATGHVAR